MNIAAEMLVIILSSTLIIFLIFAIVLICHVIGLTRQIRKLTTSAEKAVDNLESVVSSVVKSSLPVMLVELAAKYFKRNSKEGDDK